MLNTNFTNIRDIQRNYRRIAEEVNKTNKPTVVMSKNEPQFVIVSLKALQNLQERKQPNSIQALRQIAKWANKNHINAPVDLSKNHNKYAWG